jgi:hypothetical protein
MAEEASKDEQIGYHKGSLTTLAKERQELLKIAQIVEQLMQMHVKALQDLGVDLTEQMKELQKAPESDQAKAKGTDVPIDDLI